MALTESEIEKSRPERRAFRMAAGKGLYLLTMPNGSRYWRMDYRFGERRLTLALGIYPDVSPEKAATARDVARQLIKEGVNPADEKRAAKLMAPVLNANTFGAVADELIAKLEREKKAASTIRKRRWLLKTLAVDLEHRPVDRITAPEILAVLRKLERKDNLESARRLRAAIGQVMRRAVATGRATVDPTPSLRGEIATPTVKHRSAVTEADEAGRLMLAISGYDRPQMRIALMLLAYCFPRPGELRNARWSEVHLKDCVWTIPAGRAKMRRVHRIALSPQAVKLFEELKTLTGACDLCFPGERSDTRAVSDNALNMALRTLGYDGETHTAHGFRATASSLLNEHSDFSGDAIELALGHVETNETRRAYNRSTRWKERQELAVWYADFLDRLKKEQKRAASNARLFG